MQLEKEHENILKGQLRTELLNHLKFYPYEILNLNQIKNKFDDFMQDENNVLNEAFGNITNTEIRVEHGTVYIVKNGYSDTYIKVMDIVSLSKNTANVRVRINNEQTGNEVNPFDAEMKYMTFLTIVNILAFVFTMLNTFYWGK